jgi:hypothetical protein
MSSDNQAMSPVALARSTAVDHEFEAGTGDTVVKNTLPGPLGDAKIPPLNFHKSHSEGGEYCE